MPAGPQTFRWLRTPFETRFVSGCDFSRAASSSTWERWGFSPTSFSKGSLRNRPYQQPRGRRERICSTGFTNGCVRAACFIRSTRADIHPSALLGRRLFIDHAMGVVIGETAIVGSDVTLYQGVTLGGTGKGHGKRHPTVCDGVFIGNNANVLGNITVGENSRVGAGSVVLSDVPPNSTVVGVPAHIVYRNGQRVLITDPHDVKDPLSDALIALANRVEEVEKRMGAEAQPAEPFAAEEAERNAYREELERLREYVSMGEGI